MTTPKLRPICQNDLVDVLQIETEVYPYPWSQGIFLDCLQVGYHCWLLESEKTIEAYGIMLVAAREAQILNLCVRPASRRQGLGQRLLQFLLELAQRRHADTALLEVRPSNLPALGLYHAMGFNEIGHRPAYYPADNGREDALILACYFGDHPCWKPSTHLNT